MAKERCWNCAMGEAQDDVMEFEGERLHLCGCCHNKVYMALRMMRKDGCFGCDTCE